MLMDSLILFVAVSGGAFVTYAVGLISGLVVFGLTS